MQWWSQRLTRKQEPEIWGPVEEEQILLWRMCFFWLSWLWYICLQFGLGSPWAAGSNPAFFPISWSMKRILTLTSGSCGSLGLGGDGRLPCCVLASWIKGKWVNQKNIYIVLTQPTSMCTSNRTVKSSWRAKTATANMFLKNLRTVLHWSNWWQSCRLLA